MISKNVKQFVSSYGVRKWYSSYYPLENAIRTMKTAVWAYVQENHRNWDKFLPQVGSALRSAVHETKSVLYQFRTGNGKLKKNEGFRQPVSLIGRPKGSFSGSSRNQRGNSSKHT